MELTTRWLDGLAGADGRRLAALLAGLPDRSAHGGPDADAIEAAEFSERAGEPRLRLAWNVDPGRVDAGAAARFLAARGVDLRDLAMRLDAHPGAHVQVGVDGAKTKLYAYRRPLPGLLTSLVELAGGRAREDAVFGCVDFEPAPLLKQYAEFPTAEAALASGRLLAEPALQEVLERLPDGLSAGPAPIVLTELQVHGVIVGHTLHVAVDRAPERLAELAGAELSGRLATLYRRAHGLGLRLAPTYVSWNRRREPAPVRTAYYRLIRSAP